eukprot:4382038-Prymnesium_polylepis.1
MFAGTPLEQIVNDAVAAATGRSQVRRLVGKKVVIRGLTKKPELNSMVGTVTEISRTRSSPPRLLVSLAGDRVIALKAENLREAGPIDLLPPAEAVEAALGEEGIDPDLIDDVLRRAVGADVGAEATLRLMTRQAERRKVVLAARTALGECEESRIPSTAEKQADLRAALARALEMGRAAHVEASLLTPCRTKVKRVHLSNARALAAASSRCRCERPLPCSGPHERASLPRAARRAARRAPRREHVAARGAARGDRDGDGGDAAAGRVARQAGERPHRRRQGSDRRRRGRRAEAQAAADCALLRLETVWPACRDSNRLACRDSGRLACRKSDRLACRESDRLACRECNRLPAGSRH